MIGYMELADCVHLVVRTVYVFVFVFKLCCFCSADTCLCVCLRLLMVIRLLVRYVVFVDDGRVASSRLTLCRGRANSQLWMLRLASEESVESVHLVAWPRVVMGDRSRVCVATLADIERASEIKILDVTDTNHLSVCEHARKVIANGASAMHALEVLRSHDMNCEALRGMYKAVVIARLTYAAPAWWGFTSADDRKRLEAFIQRGVRLGLYNDDESTFTQLADELEDSLFHMIICHDYHVIHQLLPPVVSNTYNLRQLTEKKLQENCIKTHID